MINFKAALFAVLTIIAIIAAFAVASFQLAYPESGPNGWLMIAAIVVVWILVSCLILRVRKER